MYNRMEQSTSFNILRFFLIFIIWSLLALVVVGGIMTIYTTQEMEYPLRVFQMIQAVMMFIVPAYMYAKRTKEGAFKWLGLKNKVSLAQMMMAALAIIVSIPFNGMLYELNTSISFPEFMKPIEEWLWNRHNDDSIKRVLLYNTPLNLLFSLFIVGIVAGFSEEIFFRGGLQKVLYGNDILTDKKAYISILLTAFIFSSFHLDFFGFLPRFVIGGLFFGVLYYWSRTLWLTIWSHFFYNTVYFLTSVGLEKYNPNYDDVENISFPIYIYVISTIGFGAIIYWFYNQHKKTKNLS